MKKIYHNTQKHFAYQIDRDGEILTERGKLNKNLEMCANPFFDENWKRRVKMNASRLRESHKVVGSYVWFSDNPNGVAVASGNDVSYEFDADDIGAVRWTEVMKTLTSKKQKRHLKSMTDIAIANGDDPRDWWVTNQSVSLEKSTGRLDHWKRPVDGFTVSSNMRRITLPPITGRSKSCAA